MTYREVAKIINSMTDEQKDCDIAIHDGRTDEVISSVADLDNGCKAIQFVTDWAKAPKLAQFVDGVLDDDHPFFVI
jgi:hypothetical protein